MSAQPERGRAVVTVTDVFVAYRSGAEPVMALRGADLTLAPGERLLVAGPNGSGKSTLLRVVTGDQPVLAGRVEVGGTAVHAMDEAARRRWRSTALGFVDQHARRNLLPELDVRDNVALQLRLTGTRAAAARARAEATLERLGLARLASSDVRRLSGGEAQRVALCAAVAHGPALVLADEPTGELDDDAAREVFGLLEAVAADGTGVVLVSHDPRSHGFVDRAVRLRDGRLAEEWVPRHGETVAPDLVADSRGWVRLPAELVGGAPRRASWRARGDGGSLVLQPRTPPAPVVPATPGPRPLTAPAAATDECPLVALADVRAGYGERWLLDGLDLQLAPGSWTTVRGPSGSGKTTLLTLVTGLADPVAGRVEVGGTSWAGLDRPARAAHRRTWLAYALQRANLVETMTVAENVALAAALRGRDVEADEVTDLLDRLGLRAQLRTPAGVLSGGERQRASLARVLVSAAPVLVLDEPTSQQDEASASRVVAALADATARGAAVLVASHDPVVLDRATATVRLGAGPAQASETIASARARSAG
ncbi:ATP-binding cassette domain-containing protein [Microlunatus flavus]|uniref:Peptide/nickel transport system ATP-binding protein/energy-coupling factor transport system ATP-binding protein n=1 Tax=Microlunatus flavus TaxID=1036181 RepID=A0A1H9HEB8_9ACTN|nr:ATP-binding cassette domain-containing protein [Microlunatus flavus]SEQ60647.1 peptide/nickel transport system ATP-binding protein/energy-coupling factor transport system ATP-binding protein [Microlunatus flavus]